MYRVTKFFTDLHDNGHPYNVGDAFPRDGVSVTENRLKELASDRNKQGVPLIELVEEAPENVKKQQEEPIKNIPEEKPKRTRRKAPNK